jgi:hypothetical protein
MNENEQFVSVMMLQVFPVELLLEKPPFVI